MNILVQFPTLRRKEKFLDCFTRYIDFTSGVNYVHFNILCDAQDETMNNEETTKKISEIVTSKNHEQRVFFPSAAIYFDPNTEKISTINSHIVDSGAFDVIVIASDDMLPIYHGWDDAIALAMGEHFPDLDGCVAFDDDMNNEGKLITFSIVGINLYKEFGYLYHPDYKSLYCDNEFTQEVNRMGKVAYINKQIVRHEHYSDQRSVNSGDIDYAAKKTLHYSGRDAIVFQERQARGFPRERITND